MARRIAKKDLTCPVTHTLTDVYDLKLMANSIRQDTIRALMEAGSGHSGGALGMAEVMTALYFNVAHIDPARPNWKQRDRIVLSNGHICPGLYATLAHAGYFPVEELRTLRKLGSRLQGHPHRGSLPGLETTSGPLGSGTSQAIGIAYGLRLQKSKARVWTMVSDGEQDEGNTWEAVLFCGKAKLSNLTVIMDRNNIQIDGPTEQVMPLEPLRQKYEAFNWHVIDADGNNVMDVIDACSQSIRVVEKPTLILAHTTPGKGVSFMENNYIWHGKAPSRVEGAKALRELQAWRKRIECHEE